MTIKIEAKCEALLRSNFEADFAETDWYQNFRAYTLGEGDIFRRTTTGYLHPHVDQSYKNFYSDSLYKFSALNNQGTFIVGKWIENIETGEAMFMPAAECDSKDYALALVDQYTQEDAKMDQAF